MAASIVRAGNDALTNRTISAGDLHLLKKIQERFGLRPELLTSAAVNI